jgi:hypothetical protein
MRRPRDGRLFTTASQFAGLRPYRLWDYSTGRPDSLVSSMPFGNEVEIACGRVVGSAPLFTKVDAAGSLWQAREDQ